MPTCAPPNRRGWAASLAIVVVLPAPVGPTNASTSGRAGRVRCVRARSPHHPKRDRVGVGFDCGALSGARRGDAWVARVGVAPPFDRVGGTGVERPLDMSGDGAVAATVGR